MVPALMFRMTVSNVKAHCKIGLTATLVREDERTTDLCFLIGPKIYEANWHELARADHISNVLCFEVWCPLEPELYTEYFSHDDDDIQKTICTMNPSKMKICKALMRWHEEKKHKIIVCCDDLVSLKEYARLLEKPCIVGTTHHCERTDILDAFRMSGSAAVNTILISKVGDNSIDIPSANILIQVCSHGGSRRQEGQRLGRILRPKNGESLSLPPECQGFLNTIKYTACFYSLISTGTDELYKSSKRQRFLTSHGYSYKIIKKMTSSEYFVQHHNL